MIGTYNLQLVALSLVVAIFASYTALELVGRVSQKHGQRSWRWLVGGAVSMGAGIWSMHFIGMLAFHLPVPLAYDVAPTMLSMAIAILVSGLALWTVSRPNPGWRNIIGGAVLMGIGISAMHYTGMSAMRMSPAIKYDPPLFAVSVVIAIVASLAALRIALHLRHKSFGVAFAAKFGSAILMGLAITGMHYTGMAASKFAPDSFCLSVASTAGVSGDTLALIIAVATGGILAITLCVSALDAHFARVTAEMATELRTANEKLTDLALYDILTGLPNRALLEDRMVKAAALAGRNRECFALMFVDLDKFKPVNDTFGHAVGDELLKAAATRLAACARKSDTIARTGGDEFVVVLNKIDSRSDAATVGHKILQEMSRPFRIDGNTLNISASIGISLYPDDGKDVTVLKNHADVAMYHAKRSGRNECRFFSPEMGLAVPVAAGAAA